MTSRRATGTWLVFADQTGVADALVRRLVEDGGSCRIVVPEGIETATKSEAFRIDPEQLIDFQNLVLNAGSRLRGVVFLWGLDTDVPLGPPLQGALRLAQALQSMDKSAPLVWLVTRGTQSVEPGDLPSHPNQAGLWGLASTMATEQPSLRCTLVDLAPETDSREIDALMEEMIAPSTENQIALRHGNRYVARLVRFHWNERPARLGPVPFVRTDRTYLITGGFGGIGLATAQWLVNEGARHLVLMGRRGPVGTATEAVRKLERAGAHVMIARGDVANMGEVKKTMEEAVQAMPALCGVFHTAGVLDDGMILQQTTERFARVLVPKVVGAWNLHNLTLDQELDCFVLYSSTAPILGAAGQSNYAAANAQLDAIARWRRDTLGLTALSVNWGPWANVGMIVSLDAQSQARLVKQGMELILPEDGVQIVAELMHHTSPQAVVLPINWLQYATFRPETRTQPFLSEVMPSHTSSNGANVGANVTLQKIATADETSEKRSVMNATIEAAAQVLRSSPNRIETHQSLRDLGMDSLMLIELVSAIESATGQRINVTNETTIDQIVDRFGNATPSR